MSRRARLCYCFSNKNEISVNVGQGEMSINKCAGQLDKGKTAT